MRLDHLLSKENCLLFNFEGLLINFQKEGVALKKYFEHLGTSECEWKVAKDVSTLKTA